MKKFLTIIITIILMLATFNFVACGGTPESPETVVIEGTEGLTYKINGQGENRYATFTGLSKSCTATEIVIASHYQDVLVTEIGTGYSVLSNFTNVEKITIHK